MTAPTREQVVAWRNAAYELALKDEDYATVEEAMGFHLAALAFAAGQSGQAGSGDPLQSLMEKYQSGQASGSGAELVREVEEAAQRADALGRIGMSVTAEQTDAYSLVRASNELWPRLRAALLSGDAAREDAKRYRWLRDQDWFSSPLAVVHSPKDAVKLGHDCPSRDRLDAAIDRARGGK